MKNKALNILFATFIGFTLNACNSQDVSSQSDFQGRQDISGDVCRDGRDGINGKDGSTFLTGNGMPSNNTGNDDDIYIDLDSWDLYVKTSGIWIKKGNIKGDNGKDYVELQDKWFYDSNHHWHLDAQTSTIVKDESAHSFEQKVYCPTYLRNGFTEHRCSICGYAYHDNIIGKLQPTEDWQNTHGVFKKEIIGGFTYGLYPQTVVNDSEIINALDSLDISSKDFNDYYFYNDEYYAKLDVGEIGSGRRFSNGEFILSNHTYWFLAEPIEWEFVGNNKFNSKKLLDARDYDQSDYIYLYSGIRNWLNNDFYTSAFALDDSQLQVIEVDNSAEAMHVYGQDETSYYRCTTNSFDKVHLLCRKEYANKYGITTYGENAGGYTARSCVATDYARALGGFCNYSSGISGTNVRGYFWTRFGEIIASDGDWYSESYSFHYNELKKHMCVRPCISLI